MDNRPIGIFDSGVGGLSVVKELERQLPNEAIVYLGDSARAPYGSRSAEEIRKFAWDLVHFLLKKDIKMLVIACNTITAVCLDEIKAALDIPVIGVILPGSMAAIQQTKTGKIGVIGTEATIRADSYTQTILRKSHTVTVKSLACPLFVPLVEAGELTDENTQPTIASSLSALTGQVDTLILGCTHYPLLKAHIAAVMGSDVRLIDSGAETVRDVSVLLHYFGIDSEINDNPSKIFYTTGDEAIFQAIAEKWLGHKVKAKTVSVTQPVILIATRNLGKVHEFKAMFGHLDYEIQSLLDFPELPEIEETGTTFEENARLKAETISALTGLIVIGDDSGLCVDALNGAPGVYSHRYAGEHPTDADNNEKLLSALQPAQAGKEAATGAKQAITPMTHAAHFHTTLVAAFKGSESLVVEADWAGHIATAPQGSNGFGYDPLFIPEGKTLSAAELSLEEKNRLSHRGQALQKLVRALPKWLSLATTTR